MPSDLTFRFSASAYVGVRTVVMESRRHLTVVGITDFETQKRILLANAWLLYSEVVQCGTSAPQNLNASVKICVSLFRESVGVGELR